jgi:hypothetical protein
LHVTPGVLYCVLSRLNSRFSGFDAIRVEVKEIDIFVAKLIPPWFNVSFNLKDEHHQILASMWLPGPRPLKKALRAADIKPMIHRTWTYRGERPTDY